MKRIEFGPRCALAYVENAQGRSIVAATESRYGGVYENPATLATTKIELDRVIRILGSLRDELPDK